MVDQLRAAAEIALRAPSIFNTQPWSWIIRNGLLELWADRDRQLPAVDPDGRLLTISCGVALHHADIALGGAGIARLPDPGQPDLLAVLSPRQGAVAHTELIAATRARRTDRRSFTRQPISRADLTAIAEACVARGAGFHVVRWDQISVLALAAVRAGALQMTDPDYRAELLDWTHRPPWSGDGVPVETAVNTVPRRVPVREFAPFGGQVLSAGPDTDLGAIYAVLYTDDDTRAAWLRAGEALSAVLLTATAKGLGSATISDVTEVAEARAEMNAIIGAGEGVAQLAVRIGHSAPGNPIPRAPRRLPNEVITQR